jgi:hypothetical protein
VQFAVHEIFKSITITGPNENHPYRQGFSSRSFTFQFCRWPTFPDRQLLPQSINSCLDSRYIPDVIWTSLLLRARVLLCLSYTRYHRTVRDTTLLGQHLTKAGLYHNLSRRCLPLVRAITLATARATPRREKSWATNSSRAATPRMATKRAAATETNAWPTALALESTAPGMAAT